MTVIHLLLLLAPLSSSITTSFEQFGLKLYSTVSQNKKNENIFLSPASISLAMSTCTVGARQETLNQMLKTFEVSSTKQLIETAEQVMHIFSIANQDKQIQLKLANRLYAQKAYQLQEEYLKIIQNSFKADIKLEDFQNEGAQAVQRINAWVEQQTNNLIRNLLSIRDVTPNTRLIIINKFSKDLTNADFHEANGKISKVALMHQREKFFYAKNNDLHIQIVRIPYKNVVEQKLASQPDLMQKLLSHQNTRTEELHLYLPKFKMEATFELRSEAAAATAVSSSITASVHQPPHPIEFKADRPFLFFIRESQQNIVLFSGRFISPPTNS
ncbi:unnamed protein product [Rotaria sordida]|uniref:Serpin domain-containing protein n=2 Tax=Rotaria sordida TaxID=392033 RepID=A0A814LM78_9BILA|nr:unnamed protein product [Rotaria sordida]